MTVVNGANSCQSLWPRKMLRMALILYLAILSIDTLRKIMSLSVSLVGLTHVIGGLTYVVRFPGIKSRVHATPLCLPLFLILLSLWCLVGAIVPGISAVDAWGRMRRYAAVPTHVKPVRIKCSGASEFPTRTPLYDSGSG